MTKSNKTSKKIGSEDSDELDDFKQFIEKRRTQNKALKKIVDKMNGSKNHQQ
jgi:hypothetical protein